MVEVAIKIGETLGAVIKPKDTGEMKYGSFMRVLVEVDITKPLCRGQKISCEQKEDGWAAFMYEQLLNICHWCGHVSHDDKDCVIWLSSNGSLRVDDQQFGPWIRASQYNHARKAFVKAGLYLDVEDVMDAMGRHGSNPIGVEAMETENCNGTPMNEEE
nr:hypothetical protein CFP56_18987 [Quercus suber]